ncbi:MAG: M55 family metallopeptidase [Acidobacteriota bacterium]|nr:M55 family metallopeptidase [Acidobacteriota bacterium]
MKSKMPSRAVCVLLAALSGAAFAVAGQRAALRKPEKVLVISDLEGLDGVFDFDLQCIPFKSPLYSESRKVLAEEVNAAIKGLFAGGATSVVVYDNHYGGHNLSVFDVRETIPGSVRILSGGPVSPTLGLDSSYSAIVFIGLHSMAGTPDGVLPHSFTWDIQNIWVNGKKVGEIGSRVMLAGELGIPSIMVSGDEAACKEFRDLVPNGKCATVKWGASNTGGYSLPISDALSEIQNEARAAMQELSSFQPYPMSGPADVKVEYKPGVKVPSFKPGTSVQQIDNRTWDFKGNDFITAWLKFRSF